MQRDAIGFFDWFGAHDAEWQTKPWLVLGKGPSFSKLGAYDTSPFHVFGLNHVVTEQKLCLSHAVDIEIPMECGAAINTNAGFLVMPWIPNHRNRPGSRSLCDWMTEVQVLASLAGEGRLLWYNKLGCPPRGNSPGVQVRYFSAEAAFSLLGMAGVRTVRSLGIDGGNAYAPAFGEASGVFPNGRRSFDVQSDQIAKSIRDFGLLAGPLDHDVPVKIYVAATEEQMLSVKVLEYSIRKHASVTVEVVPLHRCEVEMPVPRDPRNRQRTPFSFQRFLIPALAGFSGRAIYLDSDMLVMSDIANLWKLDMGGASVLSVMGQARGGRMPQFSVMVLDCAKLQWKIGKIVDALDSGLYSYEDLMERMVVADHRPAIPSEWNSLERYEQGKTRLVHFTDMHTQPWIHALHPLGHLWVRALLEAIEEGFVDEELVLDHVERGWVRPSLAHQMREKQADPFLLPRRILRQDRNYSPPYRKLQPRRPSLAPFIVRYVQGLRREAWYACRPFAIRQYRRMRNLFSR